VAWGLVIIAVAAVIAWRRPRVDGQAMVSLLIAMALVLAYTYRSLGG